MKIYKNMGFRYFKDAQFGNVYILKRKDGYCLSRFQTLASLDDMLCLDKNYWFNTLKDIRQVLNSGEPLNLTY